MKYLKNIKSFDYITNFIKESQYWQEVNSVDYIKTFAKGVDLFDKFTTQEFLKIVKLLNEYQKKKGFDVEISMTFQSLHLKNALDRNWNKINDEFVSEVMNKDFKNSSFIEVKSQTSSKLITKLSIRKEEDEWFCVSYLFKIHRLGLHIGDFEYKYYKCDQFDGLINLLNEILLKSEK
jgi:hypothetical protein